MRIHSRTIRTALAFALAALALAVGPLSTFTVCLAFDGHWSLEAAHADTGCDTHRLRHHPQPPDAAVHDLDAHHPCVDLATVPPADRSVRQARSHPELHASRAAAALEPPAGRVPRTCPGPIPLARQRARALRSVVLQA